MRFNRRVDNFAEKPIISMVYRTPNIDNMKLPFLVGPFVTIFSVKPEKDCVGFLAPQVLYW